VFGQALQIAKIVKPLFITLNVQTCPTAPFTAPPARCWDNWLRESIALRYEFRGFPVEASEVGDPRQQSLFRIIFSKIGLPCSLGTHPSSFLVGQAHICPSDTNHSEKSVQSKGDILQQYGFPRNYPVFVEGKELMEQLRGTMAPELCRASATLAKNCFEDVSERIASERQVVESNTSSPRKRKDSGSQASPTKKARQS